MFFLYLHVKIIVRLQKIDGGGRQNLLLLGRGAAATLLALLHLLRKMLANVVDEMEVEEVLLGFDALDYLGEFINLIIDALVLARVDTLKRLRLVYAVHVRLILFPGLVLLLVYALLVLVAGEFLRRVLHDLVCLLVGLLIQHLLYRLYGLFVHLGRVRLDVDLRLVASVRCVPVHDRLHAEERGDV